jgi:hypothetical protein
MTRQIIIILTSMFVALAATFAFAQTTGTNIGGGAPWINKTIAARFRHQTGT